MDQVLQNLGQAQEKFVVAMVLFPGFTLLDLAGPQTVLGFHGQIHLVSETLEPVLTDSGVQILPTTTYADCPQALDILFVPGGFGVLDAMVDEALLAFLRDRGQSARFITSVCTGSLVQGAAGLLRGYQATTHWGWREVLPALGATSVEARVVADRNRISGGGVTAGIDFGLELLALLRGEETAKMLQLMMEYDPAPRFDVGTPGKAGPELTALAKVALNAPAECALMIQRQEALGFEHDRQPEEVGAA